MTRKELGEKIKAERKKKDLSVYRVAKSSNGTVTDTQINYIEDASKNYTIDTLMAYCDAMGMKILIVSGDVKKEKPAKPVNETPLELPKVKKSSIESPKSEVIVDAPLSKKPTLKDIKDSVPKNLKGLDRTQYINDQRAKHGV